MRAQEIADTSKIAVDTMFLARDLDGNGVVDHVAREKRLIHSQVNGPGDTLRMFGFRMAVYLDAAPDGKRAPHWATSWTDELGGDSWVDTTIAVPGGTLAQISINDADASTLIVLHIRGGIITPAIVKQVDSGEGTLQYRQTRDSVIVLVTSPATLDGREESLSAPRGCNERVQWPAMRFAFDAGQRMFRRTAGFECVRKYYIDQPEWKPPPFTVDSTILARDLDGNGKVDHLVTETRIPHPRQAREYRLSLYLDAPPDGREPESPQYSQHERIDVRVDTILPVNGGTLLMVNARLSQSSEVRTVYLVRQSRMGPLLGLQIDRSDGSFGFVSAVDSIVVESTSPGVVDGTELPIAPGLCPATQRPAWRYVFDRGAARFTRESRHVCIARRR